MTSDGERQYYYRPVPGSRDLVTSSSKDDQALLAIEGARTEDGLAPLHEYQGQWLGGVRLEAGTMVPNSVFDLLAPEQTPLEQAVYLHLFRLSYGLGANWTRVGKRELRLRARVSDRRLNVALDGLVSKGHLKPLHRSTRGTLYRVFLPSEVLPAATDEGVSLGQKIERPPDPPPVETTPEAKPPAKKKKARKKPGPAGRERPLESPLNEEVFADLSGKKAKGPGIGEMAQMFFAARGKKPKPAERQLAVTSLTGLLEDGFTRDEVIKALEWFASNHPREKNLDRLPYYMNQALEPD